jgi:hypothetical protein
MEKAFQQIEIVGAKAPLCIRSAFNDNIPEFLEIASFHCSQREPLHEPNGNIVGINVIARNVEPTFRILTEYFFYEPVWLISVNLSIVDFCFRQTLPIRLSLSPLAEPKLPLALSRWSHVMILAIAAWLYSPSCSGSRRQFWCGFCQLNHD